MAATSSLVYTLSSDGTYYIVGTGFTSIASIESDNATSGTNGSGLDNTWTGGVLEIPATYNSLPVLAIAPNAFCNVNNITSVVIENGLTHIGSYAFASTTSPYDTTLTSVTLPNTLTFLGSNYKGNVFFTRKGLASINLEDTLITQINQNTFKDCYGLTTITIPSTVWAITQEAFSYCRGLTTLTIPNNVTKISKWAFNGCSGLTSITIESTTNTIELGQAAFDSTNNCPIYVYRLSYKLATNWISYASRMQRIADTRYIDFVGADVSSATTLLKSIACEIGDKLLTTVVCRSAFTAPQGWTLVTSAPVISSGTSTQYMYVYSKTAESTEELFTATVASSGRIYISIINVIDRSWQEISSLNTSGSVNYNETKTITKSTNNELLYFYSFITGATSGISAYSISGDYDIFQYYGGGGRLFFVYDTKAQNTSFTLTRTNNSTSVYNTLGLELIVPSQQTNKVSWGSNNVSFSLGSNKNISISLGDTLIYRGS